MNLSSTTGASSKRLTKYRKEFWNKKIIVAFNLPWFCVAALIQIFFFFILQNGIRVGREGYKLNTRSQTEKQL